MTHCISYWDLEFDRLPVPALTSLGRPYTTSVKVGMPRIPPSIINSVFYLYRTQEDAEAGHNPGGTGFVVLFDGTFHEVYSKHFYYGVTNWHVACAEGYSVIRLTTEAGGTQIVDLNPDQWHFLPGKYDVAAVPLPMMDQANQPASAVSTRQFAQAPDSRRNIISVGDDTFMIGLFVDHNGVAINAPSARFGNISMLPNSKATIEQPNGFRGESYVVDMHSRSGFSGSPVYVYRTFGGDLTRTHNLQFEDIELTNIRVARRPGSGEPSRINANGSLRTSNLFNLLGIHWGQFPELWEIKDKARMQESRRKHLIVEGGYVEGMSGMTCVIPAWHIFEVLNMPELKKLRGQAATFEKPSLKPKAEVALPATDENPTHREDFTRLLGAAARTPEPKD